MFNINKKLVLIIISIITIFLIVFNIFIDRKNSSKAKVTPDANIYVSNDPDYLCTKIAKDEKLQTPLIIDLTPQMTFEELIFSQTFTRNNDLHPPIKFHYNEKSVLTALKSGRTVIFNGELSPALYQQLLPLLISNPQHRHLICNGKYIPIPNIFRV